MAKMKVNAQDIVALTKKEGFLAKQLYVVFTTPTKGIEPVMKVVKEHLEFQVALEKQGIMFAARLARVAHDDCGNGLTAQALEVKMTAMRSLAIIVLLIGGTSP